MLSIQASTSASSTNRPAATEASASAIRAASQATRRCWSVSASGRAVSPGSGAVSMSGNVVMVVGDRQHDAAAATANRTVPIRTVPIWTDARGVLIAAQRRGSRHGDAAGAGAKITGGALVHLDTPDGVA